MAGGEQTGDNNPKGFNECVSQEQLQAIVEDAQKQMNEAITDALIELNIGNNMERLDKRISTLTVDVLPPATHHGVPGTVICSEGYRRLQELGSKRRETTIYTGSVRRKVMAPYV